MHRLARHRAVGSSGLPDPRARTAGRGRQPRPRLLAMAIALVLVVGGCATPATVSAPPGATPSILASPAPAGSFAASSRPASAGPPTSSPTPAAPVGSLGPLPTGTLAREKATALQAVLDQAVAEAGAPDAIAAVFTADGRWAGAAGVGGPDGRAATAQDEFAIASITKTFTAALIMRLVANGKMKLDAPLASYLGDLQVDTNKATVRQALGMLAGLPDQEQEKTVAAILADPGHAWTAGEIVAGYESPSSPAGSTYIYSNPAYELLAFAAEHVTGISYGKALRAEVLDPVGAARVLDQGYGVTTPKPWALPMGAYVGRYRPADVGKNGSLPTRASATISIGGASMASDAPSLVAWAWHLFAGDIVDAAALAQMIPADTQQYGMGLERFHDFGDVVAYGHTGGKTGYGSILVVFPAKRTVIAVFVNDPEFVVEPVVRDLLEAAEAH